MNTLINIGLALAAFAVIGSICLLALIPKEEWKPGKDIRGWNDSDTGYDF